MNIKFNNIDVTDYFALNGISFGLQPFESKEKYSINGTDMQNNASSRVIADFKCIALTTTQREELFDILKTGWITVSISTNTGIETRTMRCINFPKAILAATKNNGVELWKDIAFSMSEKYTD